MRSQRENLFFNAIHAHRRRIAVDRLGGLIGLITRSLATTASLVELRLQQFCIEVLFEVVVVFSKRFPLALTGVDSFYSGGAWIFSTFHGARSAQMKLYFEGL